MRLRDLEARFLIITGPDTMKYVDALEGAQGVMFVCPKCMHDLGTRVGAHSVICWFADRGVPDDRNPKPGRWVPSGTGLDDLTFIGPAAASVLLTGGCQWHGFIRNGEATLS
jgi:hypothetical protein